MELDDLLAQLAALYQQQPTTAARPQARVAWAADSDKYPSLPPAPAPFAPMVPDDASPDEMLAAQFPDIADEVRRFAPRAQPSQTSERSK